MRTGVALKRALLGIVGWLLFGIPLVCIAGVVWSLVAGTLPGEEGMGKVVLALVWLAAFMGAGVVLLWVVRHEKDGRCD